MLIWPTVRVAAQVLLGPAGLRLPFVRLDGSTPVAERTAMLDRYQKPGTAQTPHTQRTTHAVHLPSARC